MEINPAGTMSKVDVSGPAVVRPSDQGESRRTGIKSGETSPERQQPRPNGEKSQVDELEVIRAIEHANNSLEGVYTQFEFSIHEKTKEIMVKIIDRDSGEVIREIPPEQILDMVAKMWELAGILVDERV